MRGRLPSLRLGFASTPLPLVGEMSGRTEGGAVPPVPSPRSRREGATKGRMKGGVKLPTQIDACFSLFTLQGRRLASEAQKGASISAPSSALRACRRTRETAPHARSFLRACAPRKNVRLRRKRRRTRAEPVRFAGKSGPSPVPALSECQARSIATPKPANTWVCARCKPAFQTGPPTRAHQSGKAGGVSSPIWV